VTHLRTSLRVAVRDGLSGAAALSEFTVLRAWGQNIDTDALPALGVFIPRELIAGADVSQQLRVPEIVVQVRRAGGDDLEDLLDADAAAIEPVVEAILAAAVSGEHGLASTDIDISGEGKSRVGKMNLMFRAGAYVPRGSVS
jgi:hypothetical protein